MYCTLELRSDFIASISRRADAARSAEDANEAPAPGDTANAEISISVLQGAAPGCVGPGRGRGWIQPLTMTSMGDDDVAKAARCSA